MEEELFSQLFGNSRLSLLLAKTKVGRIVQSAWLSPASKRLGSPLRSGSYQRGFAGEAQKPSPGPSHPVTAHGEFVPAKLSLNHPFC